MAICHACHGFGEWEYWGSYEICPFCEGTGEEPEEETQEEEEEDE